MSIQNLRTIRQAASETIFTENTLRWWIFQSPENGFDRVIRRVGRRIYVDLEELEGWIEERTDTTQATGRRG
jgi:hypothetical protein